MGRITQEDRKKYFDKVTEYKKVIDAQLSHEKSLVEIMQRDTQGAAYKRILLADETLNIFSYYVLLNTLSISMLGVKNEDMLGEARKTLYRAMKYMEDTVTPYIDVPFSDYEDKLAEIETFEPDKRYALIRKFGFSIQQLEEAYGDNSKWRWSFVEIWAKFATIAKNILDLKAVVSLMDFESQYREVTTYHLQLVKRLFREAADKYREKYELMSFKPEDFKLSLTYMQSLKRLHAILGERDEAETLKKKIDIWNNKMEADRKRKEEKEKH